MNGSSRFTGTPPQSNLSDTHVQAQDHGWSYRTKKQAAWRLIQALTDQGLAERDIIDNVVTMYPNLLSREEILRQMSLTRSTGLPGFLAHDSSLTPARSTDLGSSNREPSVSDITSVHTDTVPDGSAHNTDLNQNVAIKNAATRSSLLQVSPIADKETSNQLPTRLIKTPLTPQAAASMGLGLGMSTAETAERPLHLPALSHAAKAPGATRRVHFLDAQSPLPQEQQPAEPALKAAPKHRALVSASRRAAEPRGNIDAFCKVIPSVEKLQRQVDALAAENAGLKAELSQARPQPCIPDDPGRLADLPSKIRLALHVYQLESERLIAQYQRQRLYARVALPAASFQSPNPLIGYTTQSTFCLSLKLLHDEVTQIGRRLAEIAEAMPGPPGGREGAAASTAVAKRALLNTEHNELVARKAQREAEMNDVLTNMERDSIVVRQLKHFCGSNFYRGRPLPCVYPLSDKLAHKSPASLTLRDVQALPARERPLFVLLFLLGEGGFSRVYKAVDLQSMALVALKISLKQAVGGAVGAGAQHGEKKWRLLRREALICASISHENIVTLLREPLFVNSAGGRVVPPSTLEGGGLAQQGREDPEGADANAFDEIALSLELCDGGDLFDFLAIASRRRSTASPVTKADLVLILLQVSQALCYLHNPRVDGRVDSRGDGGTPAESTVIIHNDISLRNIIRGGDGTWKLADFTLAKAFADGGAGAPAPRRAGVKVTTLAMTQPYCPYEKSLSVDSTYSTASDIYSFGVVMFACFAGTIRPFEELKPSGYDALPSVVREYFRTEECYVLEPTQDIVDLIARMLDSDMAQRPTALEVKVFFEAEAKKIKKKRG